MSLSEISLHADTLSATLPEVVSNASLPPRKAQNASTDLCNATETGETSSTTILPLLSREIETASVRGDIDTPRLRLETVSSEVKALQHSQAHSILPDDHRFILQELSSLDEKVEDKSIIFEENFHDLRERVSAIEDAFPGLEEIAALQEQMFHVEDGNAFLEERVGQLSDLLYEIDNDLLRDEERHNEVTWKLGVLAKSFHTLDGKMHHVSSREEVDILCQELNGLKEKVARLDADIQSKFARSPLVGDEVRNLSDSMTELRRQAQTLREEMQLLRHNSETDREAYLDRYFKEETFNDFVMDFYEMIDDMKSNIVGVKSNIIQLEQHQKMLDRNMGHLKLDTEDYLVTLDLEAQRRSEELEDMEQYEGQIKEASEKTKTGVRLNGIIENKLELITSCESVATDCNRIQGQVNELMTWKTSMDGPKNAELQEMKSEIKKLEENSRIERILITELQNRVAECQYVKSSHSARMDKMEDWKEDVSASINRLSKKLKSNTLATVKFLEQTNDLKNGMEKKMVQLYDMGKGSVEYCKDQLQRFETEQTKRLKAFEVDHRDEIKKLHIEQMNQFEEFERSFEAEQSEERRSFMKQVRGYVSNRAQEVRQECTKMSKECTSAATQVMETLDTLMGLKDYRVVRE